MKTSDKLNLRKPKFCTFDVPAPSILPFFFYQKNIHCHFHKHCKYNHRNLLRATTNYAQPFCRKLLTIFSFQLCQNSDPPFGGALTFVDFYWSLNFHLIPNPWGWSLHEAWSWVGENGTLEVEMSDPWLAVSLPTVAVPSPTSKAVSRSRVSHLGRKF